jgi:hypothetical protein
MAGISLRGAPFGGSAPASSGPHSSWSTLSHSASLAVAIQSAANPALPRTAYARTDSASAADDPLGEPHHRHIAYDPANKRVFIANRSLNRVDVFSTTSQSPTAQISIPGASSADLSADGTTVWIGTALEPIVAIDGSSLRIRNRYFQDSLLCQARSSGAPLRQFLQSVQSYCETWFLQVPALRSESAAHLSNKC